MFEVVDACVLAFLGIASHGINLSRYEMVDLRRLGLRFGSSVVVGTECRPAA